MPRASQKDTILRAALSCFAEHGYAATRTRHIAERAGVAESALYRHHPSKEAIAQELYATYFARYAERLRAIAAGPHDPAAKLTAMIRAVLAAYREDPDAFVFTLVRTPAFLPHLPEGTVYPVEIVEGIVAAGQHAGVIHDGQANLLAGIFFGCVLRPIILATLAAPGALDLLGETGHDTVIEQAALAAIRRPDDE